MKEINLKINGIDVKAPEGSTILEAAQIAKIRIPTLCYLKEINKIGLCRICVVEVKGARSLVASCDTPISEGMEVWTNTPRVIKSRTQTLQLLLSNHERKCLSCARSGKCELQELCRELDIEDETYYDGERGEYEIDDSAPHMIRNDNKCILCRRCVAVCEDIQCVGVIGPNNRGFATYIGSQFDMKLADTSCISCGQCIAVCPTGALREKDDTDKILEAIADPNKFVAVQVAPAVRAALGEEFGYPMGTQVEGKMAAALRRLGFDKVFDTNFSADLTIMEEANELIERLEGEGHLPLITSCSPGWIKFCEFYYPEMLDNLSTCKSPQQMFGAVLKTYYAKKMDLEPENIVSVSVMPCTAKKFEIGRADQSAAGVPDVDISITTRELARLIKRLSIDFEELPDEGFDNPLGESTGAGVIFGATGGVMEAALRTAYEKVTGNELKEVEFTDVRGTQGIKEASYDLNGTTVNVAVASGTGNARKLLEMVKSGEKNYHFIEIMACPGGCVNGGGQPIISSRIRNTTDIRAVRAKALYELDKERPLRKSHENPSIKEVYDNYFEKPGSVKAIKALHTTYSQRAINKKML